MQSIPKDGRPRVNCRYCDSVITIPARILKRNEQLGASSVASDGVLLSGVCSLRCRRCGREAPYSFGATRPLVAAATA
jgi:hypothetical protein